MLTLLKDWLLADTISLHLGPYLLFKQRRAVRNLENGWYDASRQRAVEKIRQKSHQNVDILLQQPCRQRIAGTALFG